MIPKGYAYARVLFVCLFFSPSNVWTWWTTYDAEIERLY